MTPAAFRKLALGLPEACEGAHMGHADFRVGKRIFATLGHPDASFAMVKLSPRSRRELGRGASRGCSRRSPGGWGRQGSARVRLRTGQRKAVQPALLSAWSNLAPRRLTVRAAARISPALIRAYRRYLKIALRLPGAAESTSYGTPAVKVRGKLLSRWRTEAEGALAIRCDFLDRQILLQADPEAFFLTDHYRDYPMVLVRLEKLGEAAIGDVLERAWPLVAPRKLLRSAAGPTSSGG